MQIDLGAAIAVLLAPYYFPGNLERAISLHLSARKSHRSPAPAMKSTSLAPLDASQLTITLTDSPLPLPSASSASTKNHTDHIALVTWDATHGWSAPKITPYANLSLPPTASTLHYATSCFEGLKLYRGWDGKLRLFRPLENCRRLLSSATRAALPEFDPEQLKQLVRLLCLVDGPKWLPDETARGTCLYIRPTMIGIDDDLGCHVPTKVLLYVIMTCPPRFPATHMAHGLKLLGSTEQQVRAWLGGSGYAKVAANYGPTLAASGAAQQNGYDQVLWLFGPERLVTEAGGANFFVIWRNKSGGLEMVTAALEGGLILPGITRRSVLELARSRFHETREWTSEGKQVMPEKLDVVERDFSIYEIAEAAQEGRLLSAFAVGTAVTITPVSRIDFADQHVSIEVDLVPHRALLAAWLLDIMYGKAESEWMEAIED